MEVSPEEQARQEEAYAKQQEFHDKLGMAWAEIMKSPAGQFCMKDLRERCNVDNSCIHDGMAKHPDPYAVMFQEGKRCVYNYIVSNIRHDDERRKQRQPKPK